MNTLLKVGTPVQIEIELQEGDIIFQGKGKGKVKTMCGVGIINKVYPDNYTDLTQYRYEVMVVGGERIIVNCKENEVEKIEGDF